MLIFFDIDRTIWDYKNYIPDSTREAIKKAQENGHKCFINSGRTRAFIQNKDLLSIGFDGIVSGCGCMIEYNDKVILNHLISTEDMEKTLESIRRNGLKPLLEGPEHLYLENGDFEGDLYVDKIMKEVSTRVRGINDSWGRWQVNKVSCSFRNSDSDRCFRELSDIYSLMIHDEHDEKVVEMVPKGHSKGSGILEVCKILGTNPSDTMAIGDSVNDKEMLQTAGISIAMGRSDEIIKNISDYTTDHLENDGIMKALKKYDII